MRQAVMENLTQRSWSIGPAVSGVQAELFVAPSREARFLLRHAAWLVSPADGRGNPPSRLLRTPFDLKTADVSAVTARSRRGRGIGS